MNETPGLYAGPGVYPGPGFYHNMSTLCYFIPKLETWADAQRDGRPAEYR